MIDAILDSTRDKILASCKETGDALKGYPRSPNGLVVEAVRLSSEYRAKKAAYAAAHEALRQFNRKYSTAARRRFKKELSK